MSCCPLHTPEDLDPLCDAILARISAFGQLLRRHDFVVGLRENADAAKLAGAIGVERPRMLQSAFKALYCSRASDWKAFDALFESHWLGKGMKRLTKVTGSSAKSTKPGLSSPATKGKDQTAASELADQLSNEAGSEADEGSTAKNEGASRVEVNSTTDFRKNC